MAHSLGLILSMEVQSVCEFPRAVGRKETVSEACSISSFDLRVITGDVGGRFGMKGQVYPKTSWCCSLYFDRTACEMDRGRTEAISTDTHGEGQSQTVNWL